MVSIIMKEIVSKDSQFFENPVFVHFFGSFHPRRPGVMLCFKKLEYNYFSPKTKHHKEFIFNVVNWGNSVWGVVSLLKNKKKLMEETAAETGLRIIDGPPPQQQINGRMEDFPFQGKNLFTLENIPKHPVYTCDFAEFAKMLSDEDIEISKIKNNHKKA